MLDARLRALADQLTGDVYAYVCSGLFEAHKLTFSFQLAVKVLEGGARAPDPQVGGGLQPGNLECFTNHRSAQQVDWAAAGHLACINGSYSCSMVCK